MDFVCFLIGLGVLLVAVGVAFGIVFGMFYLGEYLDNRLGPPSVVWTKIKRLKFWPSVGRVFLALCIVATSVGMIVALHDMGCDIRGHREHMWFPDKAHK